MEIVLNVLALRENYYRAFWYGMEIVLNVLVLRANYD